MRAVKNNNLPDKGTQVPNQQLEQLLQLQRDILEMVAGGDSTDEILDRLCLLSEAMLPDSVGSIMLFDETREHLNVRAAPSIPPQGIAALNGLRPGPNAGSCGTAVFNEEPVFVRSEVVAAPTDQAVVAVKAALARCWMLEIAGPPVIDFTGIKLTANMPFAGHHGLVIGFLENLGNRSAVVAQVALVSRRAEIEPHMTNPGLVRIEAGQERGPGRAAAGAIVHRGQRDTACRHGIDIRCSDLRAHAADIGKAHIVGEDQDDVGFAHRPRLLSVRSVHVLMETSKHEKTDRCKYARGRSTSLIDSIKDDRSLISVLRTGICDGIFARAEHADLCAGDPARRLEDIIQYFHDLHFARVGHQAFGFIRLEPQDFMTGEFVCHLRNVLLHGAYLGRQNGVFSIK